MIIGIDVGGTHADGVLIEKGEVVAKKKVIVDYENLTGSVLSLLEFLLPENKERIKRIHLSTTLCTNALINDDLDQVGMVIQSGPGMNPDFLRCGDNVCFLNGAVDHRGQVIKDPSLKKLQDAAADWQQKGISSIGIVTKFSHRNNEHELLAAKQCDGKFKYVSLGHRISGMPNFPRRVYTTWLNSSLKSVFSRFRQAMKESMEKLGVICPVYILKADGGTMPFASGCEFPCQSVQSGPSASVMGALALVRDMDQDTLLLDIGGTTTDIAAFVDGVPLLEPYGASVAGRPTLIRSLLTRSVGLGGDSDVRYREGQYHIGPCRTGAPMAFGGKMPTPTDALVVLGNISEGDKERATQAMLQLRPEENAKKTAEELLDCFAENVSGHIEEMIDEVFSRPVYTVSAFLERKKLQPSQVITIGGPAAALQEVLQKKLALACRVPEDYEVANAVGAARARLTLEASLYADTGLGRLSIPEISLMEKPGRMFTMTEAEAHLEEAVHILAGSMGVKHTASIDFIERLEMNTVRGFSSTGKILSLKAQIRPGLEPVER